MRQYELAIRIAQIHHLVDERKYKKALAVIQTLDVRQVRALSDLKVFAEVYTKTEQYDAAKAMYLRICRSSKTRRVLHRLVYLSIRTNSLEDAEAYFEEYMRMNPSTRDALILRYRIDKASGVPIGKLIEVLQELKQEEYIEEWAYELAKLYHRAGRRDECMEECKDIMLWFGSGEIVERAKILMDHLKEKDPIPYYDDKDFTVPKKEAPNPYDTGSLPDLNEFIKERKAMKRKARKASGSYGEEEGKKDIGGEDFHRKEKEEPVKHEKGREAPDTEFIDDYEEDDFERDLVLPQAAIQKLSGLLRFGRKEEGKSDKIELPEQDKEVLGQEPEPIEREEDFSAQRQEESEEQKTAGWEKERQEKKEEAGQKEKLQEREREQPWKEEEQKKEEAKSEASKQGAGRPEQEERASAAMQETVRVKKEIPKKKKAEYVPHSQSGTGITQDLAREITAIYEMEQQSQLKEKEVKVIRERTESKKVRPQAGQEENTKKETSSDGQEAVTKPVRRMRAAAGNPKDKTNIATNLVDRMTQAIQKSASKSYIPIDIEEIQGDAEAAGTGRPGRKEAVQQERAETKKGKDPLTVALEKEVEEYQAAKERERQEEEVSEKQPQNEAELLKNLLEEEIQDPERLQETGDPEFFEEPKEAVEEEEAEVIEEPEEAVEEEESEVTEELKGAVEGEEAEAAIETEDRLEDLEGLGETVEAEEPETMEQPEEAVEEEVEVTEEPEEEVEVTEESEEAVEEEESEVTEEPEEAVEEEEPEVTEEPKETVEEEPEAVIETEDRLGDSEGLEETVEAEEPETMVQPEEEPERREEVSDVTESTKDLTKEIEAVKAAASALKDYHAPEIPVIETDYNEMPQITYEDLPTTRALQQSFQDVLRLIEGELDPSHFVLMGDGTERIVGVSKKIVHVMKASGYLSVGRIAKIRAAQLNKMDLIGFRKELKGNCLLIEEASDLLFPTITKIFSIMEEYYGDFVVILSDEGTTLDQLFRFVPVLAKRFKYIIDITKYTEKDYE